MVAKDDPNVGYLVLCLFFLDSLNGDFLEISFCTWNKVSGPEVIASVYLWVANANDTLQKPS